ncbi:unnamed protein product [Symbiodinium necroappetens]|uniref:Tyrosine-protein kinase ephrin type A/B receptor-like domain-containing protein n=1 Tax=Symbiodinium necroappetens TaxID=1628268 RepID=A0A812J9L0_9DINO|nr:unnamed protein product [Symbiodinium necroappetens]
MQTQVHVKRVGRVRRAVDRIGSCRRLLRSLSHIGLLCSAASQATNVYTCVACRPGFYRPDGETGCVPCTQLATDVFQDSWAGAMCFKCPTGAFCDASRPAEAPIALPGYFRVENQTYTAKFGKWSVESACSFNQGLADAHATEMSSWAEAKKNHRWLFQRCLPASSCLGNNQCFQLNRGVGCEMCVEGYTKYESYFLYTSCRKCPPFWWLILECCVPGVFQFFAVLVLVRAGHSTAVNRLSLAAPLLVALLQGLQMHANLSKIMNNVGAAREDLGRLIYAVTWTEVLIAPCLAPWMLCHLPVHGEADVGLYVFLVVASSFVPSAAYFLLQLFNTCRGRASRHTLVRTLIASNYVALPTALRATLEVTRCSRDANLRRTLDIDRSILCSDDPFEGTNLLQSLVIIICMVVLLLETLLHWRTLKEAWPELAGQGQYALHAQIDQNAKWFDMYSCDAANPRFEHRGYKDLVRGISCPEVQEEGDVDAPSAGTPVKGQGSTGACWIIFASRLTGWVVSPALQDLPVGVYSFIFWLSTGDLTVNFACQAGTFDTGLKVVVTIAARRLCAVWGWDVQVRWKKSQILSQVQACEAAMAKVDAVLLLKEAAGLEMSLGTEVLTAISGILGILSLLLFLTTWMLKAARIRQVPESARVRGSKLLIGVASGLRFLFAQSGEFKINDVRRQISDSATMVSTARKARFMIKSAVARGEAFERLWSGRHQREGVGSADEKVLYKKLVAAMQQVTEAELSAAVEDMCDGDMMQGTIEGFGRISVGAEGASGLPLSRATRSLHKEQDMCTVTFCCTPKSSY